MTAVTLARATDAKQLPQGEPLPPPILAGGRAAPDAALVELDVTGLCKAYHGGPAVLDGVSLQVPRGQSVALIGSNGAGKSTLLRCCLRLIEPSGGEVTLLGEKVRALDKARLRRLRAEIGFVFQRHNLVGQLSVLSNVIHGAQSRQAGPGAWFHFLASRAAREEAMHCLERVGLAEFALRRADQLSGGQSQRVAIARTLMQRPRMMFADEPVASLDPNAGEEVMNLFAELIREKGLTLVFTSHHINHALRYADRVVALRNGRIELDVATAGVDAAALRGIYD
ncbi:phosphonate transport system ATP-binding protein [Dongia mobilis]|uniref:Phosphonate transport system ATP-binding protein n=1 Tax=Dongia mobilis TaxID=578943 RepID=A0A4R6WRA5_9PROT|nr:phosphonate ABC transporter ATP-binding protein [Dongia mobilis]TDQ84132.1 phosphonate transport system ATP-binding protein [Dongia mobilis]